jgi:hypothetical protein
LNEDFEIIKKVLTSKIAKAAASAILYKILFYATINYLYIILDVYWRLNKKIISQVLF